MNVNAAQQPVITDESDSATAETEKSVDVSEYTIAKAPEEILEPVDAGGTVEAVAVSEEGAENLKAVVLQNSDGTKTARIFDGEIKYIDESGKVRFKDNAIVQSEGKYKFENSANDIKTYFPEKISDGVKLEYGDINIVMKPHNELSFVPVADMDKFQTLLSAESPEFEDDVSDTETETTEIIGQTPVPEKAELSETNKAEECIEYDNVFGEYTSVQYMPVLQGIKENIVLERYTGNNVFRFTIDIGELRPERLEGEAIGLLEPDSNEVAAIINQVNAIDSFEGDENFYYHETWDNYLELEPMETAGKYMLTVTVDKGFLEDESTVYPVIIDPTTSIPPADHYDAAVFSNFPGTNYYSWDTHPIGHYNSTYSEGRMLSNFILDVFENINVNKVQSMYYRVREAAPNTSAGYINVYAITSSNWSFRTVTWNISNSLPKQLVVSNRLLNNQSYNNIDLTNTGIQWVNWVKTGGTVGIDPECGFMIERTAINQPAKYLASANNTTYPPSLDLTYISDLSQVYYSPTKYNDGTPIPGYGKTFQARMNCYAYALQVYYRDGVSGGAYELMPGELKKTETYAQLKASYDLCWNDWNNADIFIKDRLYEDFDELGWDIQNTTATASIPAGYRKIALVSSRKYDSKNDCYTGDFHFYVRNNDGTWSHKIGNGPVLNRTMENSNIVITDANIGNAALQGGYNNFPVQYYLINKNSNVYGYPHGYGHNSSTVGTPRYW